VLALGSMVDAGEVTMFEDNGANSEHSHLSELQRAEKAGLLASDDVSLAWVHHRAVVKQRQRLREQRVSKTTAILGEDAKEEAATAQAALSKIRRLAETADQDAATHASQQLHEAIAFQNKRKVEEALAVRELKHAGELGEATALQEANKSKLRVAKFTAAKAKEEKELQVSAARQQKITARAFTKQQAAARRFVADKHSRDEQLAKEAVRVEGKKGVMLREAAEESETQAETAMARAAKFAKTGAIVKKSLKAQARERRKLQQRGVKAGFLLTSIHSKSLAKDAKEMDSANKRRHKDEIKSRYKAERGQDRTKDVSGVKQMSISRLSRVETLPTLAQAKTAVSLAHPCTSVDVMSDDVLCKTAAIGSDELVQVDSGFDYLMMNPALADHAVSQGARQVEKANAASARLMRKVERNLRASRLADQQMTMHAWNLAKRQKSFTDKNTRKLEQHTLDRMHERSSESLKYSRQAKIETQKTAHDVAEKVAHEQAFNQKVTRTEYDILMDSVGAQEQQDHAEANAMQSFELQSGKNDKVRFAQEIKSLDTAKHANAATERFLRKDLAQQTKYVHNLGQHEMRAWNVAHAMMKHDQQEIDSAIP